MQHRPFTLYLAGALTLALLGAGAVATAATGDGDAADEARLAAGFSTLEATCFSCHSPDAELVSRIAPPMAAIKKHYIAGDTSFEEFRDALIAFVDEPRVDTAFMPGAIDRFGLMPKMSFDESVLADVAYYLYYTEVEEPAWFSEHYATERAKYAATARARLQTPADYRRYGQQLAMQTKTELGSNMKKSLKEGGPVPTVSFCKTRANPIASEMSERLGAAIKRVTDRPRNPGNAASDEEMEVIEQFREALASGEQPKSAVRETQEHMIGYYPVVTNGMCLQCHGVPGADIAPETLAAINAEYPEDRATGYGANELRGIFVVTMDKQQ